MRILGIDYGDKKIGLAIAEDIIAEPFQVLRYDSRDWAVKKIIDIIKREKIGKIVVGVSEGESRKKTESFSDLLRKLINIPLCYSDETLTTQTAQKLSLEASVKKTKRRRLEDAYAAAVMLQLYLEQHV